MYITSCSVRPVDALPTLAPQRPSRSLSASYSTYSTSLERLPLLHPPFDALDLRICTPRILENHAAFRAFCMLTLFTQEAVRTTRLELSIMAQKRLRVEDEHVSLISADSYKFAVNGNSQCIAGTTFKLR
eukprot:6180617-Pleurochrysis_carterae.AAC.1